MKDLKYWVMPRNILNQENHFEVSKALFSSWQNIWSAALKKDQLPDLDIDQFLRQDIICCLKDQQQIAGLHLYSLFDTSHPVTFQCGYFKPIATELGEFTKTNNINTIMSMEYLSVSKDFRNGKKNIHLPSLIIGLGIKLMQELNIDSIVGTVRQGAPGVEEICKAIGAELLDTTIYRYNLPHKFFIAKSDSLKLPGGGFLDETINSLWENRNSLLNNNFKTIHTKKTA